MARTTVRLDDDVARAVEQLRRDRGLGTSEAVNTLARRGLGVKAPNAEPFVQTTVRLGRPRIPIDDIGAVLDAIDEHDSPR